MTVQTIGSDRVGVPAAQMYLYEKTSVAIGILSVTKKVAPGKSNRSELTEIEIQFDAPHLAKKFDILRMLDNNLEGWEFEIVSVISADTLRVYNIADIEGVEELPAVGDTVKTLRWTTALSDSTGALQVSQGPLQFTKNGATQQVIEDDTIPANNKPLPAGMYILKDGVAYPVGIDTLVPANTVMVPVQVSGLSGPINITAGDLNVQLSDAGANFDAARIGDGSGIYLKINADGSINTNDAAALAELVTIAGLITAGNASLATIAGKDFATSAKQDTGNTSLATIAGKDFATSAKQDTGNTSLATIAGKDFATSAKQDTLIAKDFATSAKQDTLIAKDFATQTTLAALSAKLPASLGAKTSAASLSVVLASDQAALTFTETALTITFQEILNLTTVAQTFVAPAGAKWMLIETDDTNTVNIRVKIGAAATISSGIQFQPGRSEMIKGGGNISVIAESGVNQKISVQFGA